MTQRGEATRARLIEATRSVVREVGYAHASTRAIAQAAGVAEGTIYRHFPDKAALFFATVLAANVPLVAWVTTLPARAGKGTVEENLIDVAVRLGSLRDEILPLELAIAADPELAAQRRAALRAAGSSLPPGPPEAVAAYLAAEQQLGRVRADVDPREAAGVLLGLLFALAGMPGIGDEGPSPERVASAVRLLVHGIEPVAGRPATSGPSTLPRGPAGAYAGRKHHQRGTR
jgi:AcrR family transcriptional regulator